MSENKKFDPYKVVLDDEEKDILESFERGEWKTVDNVEEQKSMAKEAAAHYLHDNTRINVQIATSDLLAIKEKAAFEGLPYQFLIASILHKYAAGHL